MSNPRAFASRSLDYRFIINADGHDESSKPDKTAPVMKVVVDPTASHSQPARRPTPQLKRESSLVAPVRPSLRRIFGASKDYLLIRGSQQECQIKRSICPGFCQVSGSK
jgi:hypothetical protein